ncbi:hypothetical protein HanIR_Chr17g0851411 [Helianthus annuus]|nr:hypothetical protein HanIR_Chr17g0851411 [Helianthus annuus]
MDYKYSIPTLCVSNTRRGHNFSERERERERERESISVNPCNNTLLKYTLSFKQ